MMKKFLLLAGSAVLISPAVMAAAPTAQMKAAVADKDRPEADTKRDENRKPAEMLAFAGIGPGKVVVDMLPGAGYFTRIFAKAVEPNGRVYAYFGTQYDERLKGQKKDPDYQFADLKQSYKNLGVIHGYLPQFVTPEPVSPAKAPRIAPAQVPQAFSCISVRMLQSLEVLDNGRGTQLSLNDITRTCWDMIDGEKSW